MKINLIKYSSILFFLLIVFSSCEEPDFDFSCPINDNLQSAIPVYELSNYECSGNYNEILDDTAYQNLLLSYPDVPVDSFPEIDFSKYVLVKKCLEYCAEASIQTAFEEEIGNMYRIYFCIEQPVNCNSNYRSFWVLIPRKPNYNYLDFIFKINYKIL